MSEYILAGTDGSAESAAAARWAADQAVRRGRALRLVHAWTWGDDGHADPTRPAEVRNLTGRMLTDAAQQVRSTHPGLEVHADLLTDDEPVTALLAAAAEAELLVLGSLGLGGFEGLLVGSVGLAVAARCEVPVALVRAPQPRQDGARDTAEVVVGVDTRAPADEVLDFAFREAAARGAVLRAVHGWTPPPVWGYAGRVAPQVESEQFRVLEAGLLGQALGGWRDEYPHVPVVEDNRIGSGGGAVVEASGGAALVVVGRHGRHRLGARLGPVAHAVIHHAASPVAVVPHD
ncbi:universal stress protein [Streptomyces sp. TLI_171]|uniref:universal stress protein n=1 Tax=Streptomyces sp. TLI_171 TaxID=1938859 RepID=UPI000C19387C|nr:universal stress protein [Streptomyces sp. TLI_171]RKE05067.1 nucleotide-binding universal stress UspA family protein [Streptomyces sp. TLI_171]